jgi:hypothetical protein
MGLDRRLGRRAAPPATVAGDLVPSLDRSRSIVVAMRWAEATPVPASPAAASSASIACARAPWEGGGGRRVAPPW